ncbi:hypothetical protein FPV67DRAFT_1472653 [Lyophyllum atratum]|nr:hypothetical protein FPV67DRAFT_1472653 [Lyophyllum atratum]
MFRSLFVLAAVAFAAVSAIELGTIAGFPVPDLTNVKLTAREPVACVYILLSSMSYYLTVGRKSERPRPTLLASRSHISKDTAFEELDG